MSDVDPTVSAEPESEAVPADAPRSSADDSIDDQAQSSALRVELDDIERALARLDDGTYGTCEVCGTEFDDASLALEPQCRRCLEHVA